jgi:uncharacterized protein YbjQ (UPF0145 family)
MPRTRRIGGAPSTENPNNIYLSKHLSTNPNTDPDYQEIGVVHRTEIAGINVMRSIVKKYANFVGISGMDSSVYIYLRNKILKELDRLVEKHQKIANIRFDFETNERSYSGMIMLHAYGTLYEKSVR